MIGPSFARPFFACALSSVAGCTSRNNATMAIHIRISENLNEARNVAYLSSETDLSDARFLPMSAFVT